MIDLVTFSDQWVGAFSIACAFFVIATTALNHQTSIKTSPKPELAFLYIVVVITITLPIFGYWFGSRSHPNAIGGLLPWNDAAGYFNCARTLTDGGELDSFCQRRPLYSGYLSGLFVLTGERLQHTLLLQTVVVAVTTLLFVRQTLKRWGLAAALMGLAPIAAFASQYSIATLTENLGLPLGLLGVTILLVGAKSQRTSILTFGAFLLAVAVNARAGALFLLPLLVIWPFLLGNLAKATRFLLAALILLAIAAGFLVGPIMSILLGGDPSAIHSNFSYTIYGIAAGGKGWLHIFDAHPDLVAKVLPEAERVTNVYRATWELFLERPDLTLQGLTKGFLIYLERILKYVPWMPARIVLVLCWLAGIVRLIRHRRTPEASLLALMALGIALSAPILAHDGGLRIYAATIAVDAAIVAFGTTMLSNRILGHRATPSNAATSEPTPGAALWGTAVALVLIAFALPVAIRWSVKPIQYSKLEKFCSSEELPVPVQLGRSSPILSIVTVNESTTWPARPSADLFAARLDRHTFGAIGFKKTMPGTTYVSAYNLSAGHFGQTLILVAQSIPVPSDGKTYILCTNDWVDTPLDGVKRISSVKLLVN